MLLVGLTGGIGSGKSTVARMLAERGAVVIDADELARRAIDTGTPGRDRVIAEFGGAVFGDDGEIDRRKLAAVVFEDEAARKKLESITHPEVFRLMNEELERFRETDRIVVFDAPLIVEAGAADGFDVLVVVTAPEEEQVRRVMADRDMSEADARARISAQFPQEKKEAAADVVIRNDGSVANLERQVEEAWRDLRDRARRLS